MSAAQSDAATPGRVKAIGVIAWLWVGIPFAYGLVQLIAKIPALFSV